MTNEPHGGNPDLILLRLPSALREPKQRRTTTIDGRTAWAGVWRPWGRALHCEVCGPKGVVGDVRVVENGTRISTFGPTAEPPAVIAVYATVLQEALEIVRLAKDPGPPTQSDLFGGVTHG